MTMEYNDIIIKPYTHHELSVLYGVSWRTLQRWLKKHQQEIGEKDGHYYTIRQVENRIGWPTGKGPARLREVA